jgi:hypothetical protein
MYYETILQIQIFYPLGKEIRSLSNQSISHFWIVIGRMR